MVILRCDYCGCLIENRKPSYQDKKYTCCSLNCLYAAIYNKKDNEKTWTLTQLREFIAKNEPMIDDYDTIGMLFDWLEREEKDSK